MRPPAGDPGQTPLSSHSTLPGTHSGFSAMSSNVHIELIGRTDEETGSAACERLRAAGQTPGVLYGNQNETVSVKTETGTLRPLIDRGIRVLDIAIDGETQKVMFREVQWNTFGTQVHHFDLLRIDADQRIEIEVPIELRGTAPGTNSGGQLEQPLHTVRINCSAVAVPERLMIRINHLEIGDAITVADLDLEGDAEATLDPTTVIARVVEIREELEEELGEEGEFETGMIEPEVIGRAADDDGDGDDDDDE